MSDVKIVTLRAFNTLALAKLPLRAALPEMPGQRGLGLQRAQQTENSEQGALRGLIQETTDLPRGARLAKASLGSGVEARLRDGLGAPRPLFGDQS